jgi:hypothetical protein
MSLAEFEKLYAEFELAHSARASTLQHTRRYKVKRQRAVGAGRKHKYALRDRLLMTLFWLRAYTTYEVLSFFYDLDKSSVEDNLNDMLETLAGIKTFDFERPHAEVPKITFCAGGDGRFSRYSPAYSYQRITVERCLMH